MTSMITGAGVLELGALQDWNRSLVERIGRQTDLIERMSRLQRFISPQLAETVLKSDDADLFKCHRREITAAFLDLRGFTAFTDQAEPEEVMDLLRSYYREVGKALFRFEGTLESISGDGLLIFFNDPVPCENHAEKAARLGLEIRDRVKGLRAGWLKKNYDLDIGIGLATGDAVVGNIGFENRLNYGAVGRVINLAARLCGEARGGQILTTEKTLGKLANIVEAEPLAELHLKGFVQAVSAFNILSLKRRPNDPRSIPVAAL